MNRPLAPLIAVIGSLLACPAAGEGDGSTPRPPPASRPMKVQAGSKQAAPPPPGLEVATFAGGCFWCMEPPFEALPGVKEVLSGYTGGPEQRPAYRDVASGRTGHAEAVRVVYDPDAVTYQELLDTFWRSIDPTDAGGQFADRGPQYRTAIFVHDDTQRRAAEASKRALTESGRFARPIVTPVEDAAPFWVAEDNHQDYYRKNPDHYRRYRVGSGRAGFLERVWGKS